jgi:dihydropteroate synthase
MNVILNIHGRLVQYEQPAVMAIINATPDSFFAGSRSQGQAAIAARTELLLSQGADMIDLGAYSTRPGAQEVSADEELARLLPAISAIRSVSSQVPLSVDTFRASVARRCIEAGADIINDISGGTLDSEMFATVAELRVPYILMHMRGNPATMQQLTDYSAAGGVTAAVLQFFAERLQQLCELGATDVILDPGYGFAKTLEQNWQLMRELPALQVLNRPLLVGISRKSMMTRALGITADEALEATTVANVLALQGGAAILRVHDPLPAKQAITLLQHFNND